MKNMNWRMPNSKRGVKKVLNIEPNQNNNLVKGLNLNRKIYF
jgi:hypothetical protein